jgi:hypothetical protein
MSINPRACSGETPELAPRFGFRTPYLSIDTSWHGDRRLCDGLRLEGASFECADNADLNARTNASMRSGNLASPHVALWTHVVRERAAVAQESATAHLCG